LAWLYLGMNLGFFLPLIAYCLKRGSPHYDASKEFQVPGFVMIPLLAVAFIIISGVTIGFVMELNRLIFR
jgi:hypothetical protein